MSVSPAPITQPVLDATGVPTLPWTLFFNQNFSGDAGTNWTPTFVDLTKVGEPTVAGRFYRLSQYLVYFTITVTPATSTTATAGTTYIDNFPLTVNGDGFCTIVSGNLGGAIGQISAENNRIYVPSWNVVTVPLTILGFMEAR